MSDGPRVARPLPWPLRPTRRPMSTRLLHGPAEPTVTFWGAARAVTGSMHLVEAGGRRVLLDCGMVRGSHAEAYAPAFSFDPRSIDAVVLTHSHIDHCGNLPTLVRRRFAGPIYCTAA